MDPKTVQALLRWTSPDLMMRIYTHAQVEEMREAVARYEARWRSGNHG